MPIMFRCCHSAMKFSVAVFAAAGLASSVRNEAPMIRDYLQVGGHYAKNTEGEHIFQDQMYVERLAPVNGTTQRYPLVMLHGAAQSATNWLNKPDGGRGWASLFIEQGFEVYLVDQTSRGRSTWQPTTGPTLSTPYSAEYISQYFTAIRDYDLWPQAVNHTQWNGTGVMGDAVFDRFYSSQVQFTKNSSYQQSTIQAAGAALLDYIGKPAVLLGHSAGGPMPIVITDAIPELSAGLILLEPSGPPFENAINANGSARPYGVAEIPITYDPPVKDPSVDLVKQTVAAKDAEHVACVLQADDPPPRKLVNLADKPILVITSESSYHAPYDYCTVEYLRQAGCDSLEYVELGEVGIHGNAHMMFMEMNSDEIQGIVRDWISKL